MNESVSNGFTHIESHKGFTLAIMAPSKRKMSQALQFAFSSFIPFRIKKKKLNSSVDKWCVHVFLLLKRAFKHADEIIARNIQYVQSEFHICIV